MGSFSFKAIAKLAISFAPVAVAAKPAQAAKIVQSAETITAAKGASRYPLRSKNQQMAETVVTNKATTAEKVVETAKVDKSKTFTPQYALNAKNVNKTAEARVANPKLGVTIASGLTKPKAKELLRENSFGLPKAQIKTIFECLDKGAAQKVNIKRDNYGMIKVQVERPGRDSGFQRMSFKIDHKGEKLFVVQTAFDGKGKLVRQKSDTTKKYIFRC